MSQVNFLDLDDYSIEDIVKCLSLSDQCSVSQTCARIQGLCMGIWRRDKLCCDTIKNEKVDLSFAEYKYFICLMCEHFKGLVLRTTDIEDFCEATKDIELPKLEAIRIDRICSTGPLPSIAITKKCKNLKEIILSQPLLDEYIDDILQIKTLKRLEVIRYYHNFDNLIKRVLSAWQASIKKIHTRVDTFPPCWLSEENTFPNLEELGLETQYCKSSYQDTRFPPLVQLKILYLFGWDYCHVKMVEFISNCQNLERVILYKPNGMDKLLSVGLTELFFDQYDHEYDIVEFRKSSCQKPFEIPVPRARIYDNRTEILFL